MTAATPAFALIGRTYTGAAFELLYQASLVARAERRAANASPKMKRVDQRWRDGLGHPVLPPPRFRS